VPTFEEVHRFDLLNEPAHSLDQASSIFGANVLLNNVVTHRANIATDGAPIVSRVVVAARGLIGAASGPERRAFRKPNGLR